MNLPPKIRSGSPIVHVLDEWAKVALDSTGRTCRCSDWLSKTDRIALRHRNLGGIKVADSRWSGRIRILYRLSSDLAGCTEPSRSGNAVSNIGCGMVASSGQGKHRSHVTKDAGPTSTPS